MNEIRKLNKLVSIYRKALIEISKQEEIEDLDGTLKPSVEMEIAIQALEDAQKLEPSILVDGTYHYNGKDEFFNKVPIENLLDKPFDAITIFDHSIWVEKYTDGRIKISQYHDQEVFFVNTIEEATTVLEKILG